MSSTTNNSTDNRINNNSSTQPTRPDAAYDPSIYSGYWYPYYPNTTAGQR